MPRLWRSFLLFLKKAVTGLSQDSIVKVLPCVKIGKDYLTSYAQIEKWIDENKGTEIYI